jgi:hypothetical protein
MIDEMQLHNPAHFFTRRKGWMKRRRCQSKSTSGKKKPRCYFSRGFEWPGSLLIPKLSDIVLEKNTLASYVVVSKRDIVSDIDNTINPEGIKKDE